MVLEILLPLIALATLALLLHPRLRTRGGWTAMVTPLASIIGSGFLVIAPLLGHIAGPQALLAMALIVLLAYAIGGVIRFNIRHAEPALASGKASKLVFVERLSNLALSLAYIVSVTFYLRLMGAFIFDGLGLHDPVYAQSLTTLTLAGIGLVGWRYGLSSLEKLETVSVSIKLAIIAALLVGLGLHDLAPTVDTAPLLAADLDSETRLRMLAGMLLVVQGFETSRYLGARYDAQLRIRSMRQAQWLAGLIYLVFIALITPLLANLSGKPINDTAIIGLAEQVAWILSPMLIVAAVMSQFSAAVADTVGAGGLLEEESHQQVPAAQAYLWITGIAIVLVWSANVFEIVAYASRAFALYYALQALVALLSAPKGPRQQLLRLGFALIGILLFAITLFALPMG